MKQVTLFLHKCGDRCPHYAPDDVDVGRGCLYSPPYCGAAKRALDAEDRKRDFPAWCPLENPD